MKNQGMPNDMFDGRPVIGICNTFSELTPCNAHFRDVAESIKKGVLEAGGFPLEFPIMSLGETLLKPTAMLFRKTITKQRHISGADMRVSRWRWCHTCSNHNVYSLILTRGLFEALLEIAAAQ